MNSECEDNPKTDDLVEMNGVQENGSPKQVSEDKMTTGEDDATGGKDLKKSDNSSVDISVTRDSKAAGAVEEKLVRNHSVEEAGQVSDTNGDLKSGDVSKEDSKDGAPQRRMSLRPRAAPKKYKDPELSSDDDLDDPLATRDPLAIPLSKSATTVLVRKSPTTLVGTPKPGGKTPVKAAGKVTRPPPELIKAPTSSKILISPATTVSLVPRSKENSKPTGGFVIVDTQSILTGKGPVAVSSAATGGSAAAAPSVTVSAVSTKQASSNKLIAPSILASKKTAPPQVNSASLPDPFESLGLADDSFIVEAPSFVVPYLIEKAGPKDLKTTLAAINPPAPKKEEVIVLSEEDSGDDSDDKKEDSKTPVTADKSSMKSEMEKSAGKSDKDEDNYFAGPIGRFFLDIGLSLVQEYVQGDLLRVQKRKVHKGSKISDPGLTVAALSKGLEITKAKNDAYRLPWRQCDQCNFKSELKCIMAHHWSQPLTLGGGATARFGCHWCPFEAKESHLAVTHIETEHGMKCRMGAERTLHQCPLCPFEDNVKSKVTRHVMSCQKRFIPDRNLEPPVDWEPPAKIPRMPAPRGMRAFPAGIANNLGYQLAASKGLAVPYHPLLPKSALLNTLGYSVLPSATGKGGKVAIPSQVSMGNLRLPAELHIVQGSAAQRTASAAAAQAKTTTSYRLQSGNTTHYQNPSYAVPSNQIYQALGKSFQLLHGQGIGGSVMSVLPAGASKALAAGVNAMEKLKKASSSNSPITLVPGLVNTSGLTIQSSTNPTAKAKTNQQPSISITPLPRSTAAASVAASKPSLSVSPVTPSTPASGNAQTPKSTGQAATPGQKGSVVCEICDGSIKDLEQLRHHMQWIHKVKIHPKMIHNRPPLNCQKCQCRFFTDQGLERHLLGSHGLVTSSMQEAANRGQDGGRCPICGKVHQWKLLSHVVKDHGLSLKPAHLSYKCTVCTATFTMYKLFENHVYTAHSVVAKKVLDKDNKKTASSGSATPLRINDEITIIPQSAGRNNSDSSADLSVSRTCKGDSQSKRSRVDVIDLSDDEDARGDAINLPKSQVTITKVPAPVGYKNSREPLSKRSRTEDNDTE